VRDLYIPAIQRKIVAVSAHSNSLNDEQLKVVPTQITRQNRKTVISTHIIYYVYRVDQYSLASERRYCYAFELLCPPQITPRASNNVEQQSNLCVTGLWRYFPIRKIQENPIVTTFQLWGFFQNNRRIQLRRIPEYKVAMHTVPIGTAI
jgi:hypothetical protein